MKAGKRKCIGIAVLCGIVALIAVFYLIPRRDPISDLLRKYPHSQVLGTAGGMASKDPNDLWRSYYFANAGPSGERDFEKSLGKPTQVSRYPITIGGPRAATVSSEVRIYRYASLPDGRMALLEVWPRELDKGLTLRVREEGWWSKFSRSLSLWWRKNPLDY